MRETAMRFGFEGRLHGVLSTPDVARPRRLLILVNAGFVPKFGPYRVYVQLARRLASDGVATLRFDLSGLGDSLPNGEGALRERTRTEIAAAVEALLARFPGSELMLGGICSGAEDALRYAETDPRVQRLVLVDPFAYRTAGWEWRHGLHRLVRRTLRFVGAWRSSRHAATTSIIDYRYLERAESRRILEGILARDGAIHFIYTAGRRETFNHAAQLWKMFPDLPLERIATVDFVAHLEHTQLLQEDRDTLIRLVSRRLGPALAR